MTTPETYDVVVIGAGIAGIATAFYLAQRSPQRSIAIVDPRPPMSYTSAQSGDNYRNWWPHPAMAAFTNDSIDELERLHRDSGAAFHMTHSGYLLATRRPDAIDIVAKSAGGIDIDIVAGNRDVQSRFPFLHDDIANAVHIKRGGDFDSQQLASWMLAKVRDRGGKRKQVAVTKLEKTEKGGGHPFSLGLADGARLRAGEVVIAAGPFVAELAAMLGVELPVTNVFQQKIAFDDARRAVPRDMPFTIDLDAKVLDFDDEERALLAEDEDLKWLAQEIHGGTHCRPEGGPNGTWVKLGWAYNQAPSDPQQDLANEPRVDSQFPEIVLRGAAMFLPSLKTYVDNPPTRFSHYGGYYTMTEENWPMIGPLGVDGAFVVGALSGFGSMAACAAAKLCAAAVSGDLLPSWAESFSPARLHDEQLLRTLRRADKGIL